MAVSYPIENSSSSFARLILIAGLFVIPLPLKRIANRIREELLLQSILASILGRVLIRRKLARNLEKSSERSRSEVTSRTLVVLQNGKPQSDEFFPDNIRVRKETLANQMKEIGPTPRSG